MVLGLLGAGCSPLITEGGPVMADLPGAGGGCGATRLAVRAEGDRLGLCRGKHGDSGRGQRVRARA